MASIFDAVQIDPSQLQGLLGMLGPSQADQDAANQLARQMFFAGLMGARKGFEGSTAAEAAQNALMTRQQMLLTLPKQRMENLQSVMPLIQLARQQQFMKTVGDALNQSTPTIAGPAQAFQQPGGAAGTMNSSMGANAPAPSMLPTQVPDPAAEQRKFQLLNNLNIAGRYGGMPDISGAINAAFPAPTQQKPGSLLRDRFGNVVGGVNPGNIPAGYYFNPASGRIEPTPGGPEAQFNSAQNAGLGKLAGEPAEPQVDASGNTFQPQGSRYQQVFGAQSPFAPSQAPTANAETDNAGATAGPHILKQSPAAAAEQQERGKDTAEYRNAVFAAGDSARSQDARIGEMQGLLQNFTSGPTLPMRAGAAGYAQEVPLVGRSLANMLVPNSEQALPAITGFNKLAVQWVAEQSKVFGTREAAQIVQMVKDALPHAGMVPGAPELIFNFMSGMNNWAKQRQDALTAWEKNHNGSANGFRESWEAANPPSKFVPPLGQLAAVSGGNVPAQQQSQTPTLTPAGASNKTVQLIMRGNPSPAQIEALRAKGYLQ